MPPSDSDHNATYNVGKISQRNRSEVTICWYCGSVTRGHAVDFHSEQNVISAATWYFIYHYAAVYVTHPSSDRTKIPTTGALIV